MYRIQLLLNGMLYMGFALPTVQATENVGELKQISQCPHAMWLGRQTNAGPFIDAGGKLHFKDVVESKGNLVDRVWGEEKDSMSIDLRIVAGSKVRLPDTLNGYVTLINGEIGCVYKQTAMQNKNAPNWYLGGFDLTAEESKLAFSIPEPTILPINDDSMYIVGIVKQKEVSKAYYSLNVRVTSGPFTGAIVHLIDDGHPASRKDPFVAIYKIPDYFEVNEGNLNYRLVRIIGK